MSKFDTSQYFVSIQNGFLVVLMKGSLDLRSLPSLIMVKKELKEHAALKHVVFDMSQVTSIQMVAHPFLTLIFRDTRKDRISFKMCGLSAKLQKELIRLGIVNADEISSTLMEGLQIITDEILTGTRKAV